jgi:hypothetical protein
MFARSYIPTLIPSIMKDWSAVLQLNNLPFVPENIFESKETKMIMSKARDIYENNIKT